LGILPVKILIDAHNLIKRTARGWLQRLAPGAQPRASRCFHFSGLASEALDAIHSEHTSLREFGCCL
jgi:hypothetical protein